MSGARKLDPQITKILVLDLTLGGDMFGRQVLHGPHWICKDFQSRSKENHGSKVVSMKSQRKPKETKQRINDTQKKT